MSRCDLMLSLTLTVLAALAVTLVTLILHHAAHYRELQRWLRHLHQALDRNPENTDVHHYRKEPKPKEKKP